MANLKMPFGNTIFMVVLFFGSRVTGITNLYSVCSYTEQAAYDLADVAHTSRFEFAIRSTNPEWYSEGMKLLAYYHNGHYWGKRNLSWKVENNPYSMAMETVETLMEEAFDKWKKASPFTFRKASSNEQADIRIKFVNRYDDGLSEIAFSDKTMADDEGMDIEFENRNWRRSSRGSPGPYWVYSGRRWYNFRRSALFEIGRTLGLDHSDDSNAALHFTNGGPEHPAIGQDDIDGLRALYPTWSTPSYTTPTFRIRQESSSSSSTSSD